MATAMAPGADTGPGRALTDEAVMMANLEMSRDWLRRISTYAAALLLIAMAIFAICNLDGGTVSLFRISCRISFLQ
jgi:hypothetical protein